MRAPRRRYRIALPAAVIGALCAACVSTVPEIDRDTPGFAEVAEDELVRLAEGRGLYVAKCSGCHPLHPPSEGDAEFWEEHVVDMAGRARISDEESGLILRYLEAASSVASR